MKTIIITIDGGLVQSVHTDSDKDINVIIADRDIIKNPCGNRKEQKEYEKKIEKCQKMVKNMKEIY